MLLIALLVWAGSDTGAAPPPPVTPPKTPLGFLEIPGDFTLNPSTV